jgi:hypothetical protein
MSKNFIDVLKTIRNTWGFNPQTHIQKNKKKDKKKRRKDSKKTIRDGE